MIDIRLPNITGSTEREQLVQMKSYLHQLAEQLQWALQNVDTSNNTVVAAPTARSLAPSSGSTSGEINAQATFASIKSLIIKSAEIVDAYYDEINAELEGHYVAQSDFGTYQEDTKAQIEANSKGITQTYTNIQAIYDPKIQQVQDDLGNATSEIGDRIEKVEGRAEDVEGYIRTTKATIKTGELGEENGKTIIGLEIGQIDAENGAVTRRYARFTAEELSFYDANDNKVAWISNKQLHIADAVVKSTFCIGNYFIDASNGLAFKWVENTEGDG